MGNIDEINKLKEKLEIREKFIEQLKEYNEQLKACIKPFEDSYFNGLSPIEIAEYLTKLTATYCEYCTFKEYCEDNEDNISCREVLKQWLQQESEG